MKLKKRYGAFMELENVTVWVALVPAPTPMAMPVSVVAVREYPVAKGIVLQSQLKTAPALFAAEVLKLTVSPPSHVPLPEDTGGVPTGGFHWTDSSTIAPKAEVCAPRPKNTAARREKIIFMGD